MNIVFSSRSSAVCIGRLLHHNQPCSSFTMTTIRLDSGSNVCGIARSAEEAAWVTAGGGKLAVCRRTPRRFIKNKKKIIKTNIYLLQCCNPSVSWLAHTRKQLVTTGVKHAVLHMAVNGRWKWVCPDSSLALREEWKQELGKPTVTSILLGIWIDY